MEEDLFDHFERRLQGLWVRGLYLIGQESSVEALQILYAELISKITDSGRCPYYHPLNMFGQALGRWVGIGFWLVKRSWGSALGHARLECRYLEAQHRYAYVFDQCGRIASFDGLMTHLPFVPIAEKSPGPLSFRGVLPLAGAMAKIDVMRRL